MRVSFNEDDFCRAVRRCMRRNNDRDHNSNRGHRCW